MLDDACGQPHLVERGELELVPHNIPDRVRPSGRAKRISAGFRVKDASRMEPMVVDGHPVTCQLEAGHRGWLHGWLHALHVEPGQRPGHGGIFWPTEQGAAALTAGRISQDDLHNAHSHATRLELNTRKAAQA